MRSEKSLLRSSDDESNIQKETFQIDGKQILGDHDSEDDCTVMATIWIIRLDL
jgi:hypothetical protein